MLLEFILWSGTVYPTGAIHRPGPHKLGDIPGENAMISVQNHVRTLLHFETFHIQRVDILHLKRNVPYTQHRVFL